MVTEVLYKRIIICVYVYWRVCFLRVSVGNGRIDRYDMAEGFAVFSDEQRESLRLYGQVNKRTWWMPWQPEAMKDVVGNENLGEPSNRL